MRDATSIARLNLLHPKARPIFQHFIEQCETAYNVTIRIVQGLRTFAEQDALYAQGRTKPGKIITFAKGGQTYHCYGAAVDLLIIENGKGNWNFDYTRLLHFMPAGMVWGGSFSNLKDLDHFELKFGLNWRDMLAKYNAKDFIQGTQYINI